MADVQRYVLGTPYEGYNSQVTVDLPKVNIKSGLIVCKDNTGKPAVVGAGVPYGVSGQNIYKFTTSVHTNGLKVCVRLADGATPTIGAAAYATAEGKITETKDANIAIAATFASGKIKGIDTEDGSEVDAVLIDFPGGI